MTDWTDETLRPLEELARLVGAGVTADTLKRRARQGKLTVYRPGKAYLSTLVNVRAMIESTRIGAPRATPTAGQTRNELANLALDHALRVAEDEWVRKYNARKAARKPPRA